MKRLEDKVAIVTGAGKGIGRAAARTFALRGAKVLVVDTDQGAGEQTVEEIRKAGNEASFFKADVGNENEMLLAAQAAVERYGKIDILVANAGIYLRKSLEELSGEDWNNVLRTNLNGVFHSVKACLPHMKANHGGRVVVTSAITGNRTGIPGLSHYAASKAGINGFVRSAAVELAKDNITINAVEPGNIQTEGLKEQFGDEYIEKQAKAIPLGRMGKPEEVADAMLFLASDESRFITGQTLVVDGGQVLPESRDVE